MQTFNAVKDGFYVYHLKKDGDIVYVGQTCNLLQRVLAHYKEGVKDFDSMDYVSLDSHKQMMRKEFIDITINNPKYNNAERASISSTGFCSDTKLFNLISSYAKKNGLSFSVKISKFIEENDVYKISTSSGVYIDAIDMNKKWSDIFGVECPIFEGVI